MPLVCLGLSHHSAPVEIRERHSVPAARLREALVALCDYEAVLEAVMVSTCNRMEIYAELADYEAGVAQLKAFLHNFRHGAVGDLNSYLYTLLGSAAVEHLLRVSTGIDSMLVGEAEILGQVKSAYVGAQRAGTIGPILHEVFRTALQAGKRARSQTRIGAASVSVASAAVDFAARSIGAQATVGALVVGAGKMGQLVARRLRETYAHSIVVANRTRAHAEPILAEVGGGRAIGLDEIQAELQTIDIVITAVGSDGFVIDRDMVKAAASVRGGRPLTIIDIAVPRDVDPDVAFIDNVNVIDIDALRDVVDDTLERRKAAIPAVESLVAEYVERFAAWYRSRPAIPAIARLAQAAENVREEEIARLLASCPELSERERRRIIGASRRIVSRLLHPPIQEIRRRAETDVPAAVELGRILTVLFLSSGSKRARKMQPILQLDATALPVLRGALEPPSTTAQSVIGRR